uniref:Uncharacterized protein n=1 Tax=Rhizophagus irregularis (strain DAOM 181602 / DAOM 197198 / MUCL 43194) TaxID=747089 RepID=U9TDR4_RHIID
MLYIQKFCNLYGEELCPFTASSIHLWAVMLEAIFGLPNLPIPILLQHENY